MIDVLVFSHSCLRRVNRLVYEELISVYGLKIQIIVPAYLESNDKKIFPDDPVESDNADIHKALLKGKNPRNYYFEGASEIIKRLNPKIVLIDADPASYMSLQLIFFKAKFKFKLFALTCENQSLGLIENYKRRGIKGSLKAFPKSLIALFSTNWIDQVFTINDLGTQIYKDLGFKNVCKIPLGYSSDVFFVDDIKRDKIRSKYDVKEKIVFIYVGRIVKEKGVHILIEALSQLMNHNNWVLFLDEFSDANNTYMAQIEKQINKLNLIEKIVFFNASHAEIPDFINAADVVVMPSISTNLWVEQYGRVAPEALACGKLIIASRTGALPELISKAGILVEEGNVLELKNNIEKCIVGDVSPASYRGTATDRAKELSIQKQSGLMMEQFKIYLHEG